MRKIEAVDVISDYGKPDSQEILDCIEAAQDLGYTLVKTDFAITGEDERSVLILYFS